MSGSAVAALVISLTDVSARAMAPQITGPPPYGVFHDLRWVMVFHTTWWSLMLLLALVVAFRTVFTTYLVHHAWPADLLRPSPRVLARRACGASIAALLVLALPATLLFAAAITSLSWVVIAAVPFLLGAVALTHHAVVVPGWWRTMPPWRSTAWVLATFAVWTVAGGAIVLVPPVLAAPLAGLAGAWSAFAWCRVVDELARVDPPRGRLPLAPAAVALLWGVSVLGVLLVTGPGPSRPTSAPPGSMPAPAPGQQPVLVAAGFGSSSDGSPQIDLGPGFFVQQFSYRGVGSDGRPLPYVPMDTHASIGHLSVVLEDQVRQLHVATGSQVALVVSSEATTFTRLYLAGHPDAPVAAVLFLSPLEQPARVYYPARGDRGWGWGAGWAMRALAGVIDGSSTLDVDPDIPFLRSLVEHAPALRDGVMCPIGPGHQEALVPIASATTSPHVEGSVPVDVVASLHGVVPPSSEIADELDRLRTPTEAPGTGGRTGLASFIGAGSAAWLPPVLPLGLNPVWDVPDVGPDATSCEVAAAALRRWSATLPTR